MPTEVIATIGIGGTWTTLESWREACPPNLVTADIVWIGEVLATGIVYSVGAFGAPALTISGITTDATRFVWLRAAPGASFKDHADKRTRALRYNESNGAFIRISTPYASCMNVNSSYFRMTGLQLRATNSENYGFTLWGAGSIIEDCIFGNQFRGGISVATHTIKPTFRNNVVYSEAGDAGLGLNLNLDAYKGANIINVTFIRPASLSPAGAAINTEFGQGVIIDNCAMFGYSATAPIVGEYPFYTTVRNCATSGSSLGGSFQVESGNLTGLTFANQFEAVAPAGSMDLRPKSGHGLAAGRDTTAFGVTADIVGFTRTGTWTIGAWQDGLAPRVAVSTITYSLAGETVGAVVVAGSGSDTYGVAGSAVGALAVGAQSDLAADVTGATAGAAAVAGASAASFAMEGAAAATVALVGGSEAALSVAAVSQASALVAGTSEASFAAVGATAAAVALGVVSVATLAAAGVMQGVLGPPPGAPAPGPAGVRYSARLDGAWVAQPRGAWVATPGGNWTHRQ